MKICFDIEDTETQLLFRLSNVNITIEMRHYIDSHLVDFECKFKINEILKIFHIV